MEPRQDLERHLSLASQIATNRFSTGDTALLLRTLAINGVTFFLYLQLSFATLSYVSVVTHAILNSFRRPAVIIFDVIVLKTVLSDINKLGVAIACVGVAVYSLIKASGAAAPQDKRAKQS